MSHRKNMYLAICLEDVKKIASIYGTNDVIAERLGLTREQFNYVNYYHYLIVDNKLRSWAIDFSSAITTGKALYKLDKLEKLSDVEDDKYLSLIEKKYARMKARRNINDKDKSSLFN